jgi:heme/copper-type cytochrome/quinol oxidase subunit 1
MINLVRYYIKTSIVFLFLGLMLGGYMIYVREVRGAYPDIMLITAHTHMILIGFVMMMILGVALWMFPKPRRDDRRYRPDVAVVIYWVMVLSVSARFLGEVLKSTVQSPAINEVVVLSAILQIMGIIVFFTNLLPRIRGVTSRVHRSGKSIE